MVVPNPLLPVAFRPPVTYIAFVERGFEVPPLLDTQKVTGSSPVRPTLSPFAAGEPPILRPTLSERSESKGAAHHFDSAGFADLAQCRHPHLSAESKCPERIRRNMRRASRRATPARPSKARQIAEDVSPKPPDLVRGEGGQGRATAWQAIPQGVTHGG